MGCSSAVERRTLNSHVTGSIPVAPAMATMIDPIRNRIYATSKVTMPDSEIEALTKHISQTYKGACAPGLVISNIPGGHYYVSVVKYGRSHMDKIVQFSASAKTLEGALKKISERVIKDQAKMLVKNL